MLKKNTELDELNCCNNDLLLLNVDSNKFLKKLYCYGNNFKQVDISNISIFWHLDYGDEEDCEKYGVVRYIVDRVTGYLLFGVESDFLQTEFVVEQHVSNEDYVIYFDFKAPENGCYRFIVKGGEPFERVITDEETNEEIDGEKWNFEMLSDIWEKEQIYLEKGHTYKICYFLSKSDYCSLEIYRVFKKDSESTLPDVVLKNPSKDENGKYIWDSIYFGNYPQSDSTGQKKEPIKWWVLSVDDNDAFLLSDKILDVKPFNTTDANVTWENSSLRNWLNSDFINNAFSVDEQKAILESDVDNSDSQPMGEEDDVINNTKDKVYLLSNSEAVNEKFGFSIPENSNDLTNRLRKYTEYAAKSGNIDGDMGDWWYRTAPEARACASFSSNSGSGCPVTWDNGVCPILNIDISDTSVWSYAGTVSLQDYFNGTNNVEQPDEQDEPETNECQHSNTEIRGAKDATATADGYTGDTYCLDCGKKIKSGHVVAKLGNVNNDDAPKINNSDDENDKSDDNISQDSSSNSNISSNANNNNSNSGINEGSSIINNSGSTSGNTGSNTGSNIVQIPDNNTTNNHTYDVKKIDSTPTVTIVQTQNQTSIPVVNTKVSVDKGIYRITSSDDNGGTVEYLKPVDSSDSSVNIPAKLIINGKAYIVTSIAAQAFKNSKKLKQVNIGKNINKIGKQAFYNCKKLKKLIIRSKKLTNKNVGSNAFKGVNKKVKVYVPENKINTYKKLLKKKGLKKNW